MENVFFIGINGIGMSALAKIMVKKGYKVYGSDLKKKEVSEELERLGVKIYYKHTDVNVRLMDMIVYSSAIKRNNPEYIYGILNNIKLIRRGELLAKLLNAKKGIAVSGTHGKTSTSSMMGVVSLELDPTIAVGGIIPEIKSNGKYGEGEYFVAEADESDNSFLGLYPEYSIITNIEEEHMEIHGSYDNLKRSFNQFLTQTSKYSIINMDCEELFEISKRHDKIKTYSIINEKADIYAKNIKKGKDTIKYDVVLEGKELGTFVLKFIGEHNVSNSLGVIYIAKELGISTKDIKEKLENFIGPKRRFEILYNNKITIVDDYAHHPTEVEATLKVAKDRKHPKIISIFQPHKYSRTNFLLKKYTDAFKDADEVIMLPIYSAGEINEYDISVEKLVGNIDKKITIIKEKEKLFQKLSEYKNNEICVFMGAGDISNIAKELVERIKR